MDFVNVRLINGNVFSVPIYPTITNSDLYNYILGKLQTSTGALIYNAKEIPYNNELINVNSGQTVYYVPVSAQTQAPVTTTITINDVDNDYNRLNRRIQDLGAIYLLWRRGQTPKEQVKSASDTVKEAMNNLNKIINLVNQ
jgi:hypothetical protein